LWQQNRAYLGAFVAHVGVLVAILGFLGNYRGLATDMTLQAGEQKSFSGYTFGFDGITTRQDENATLYEARLRLAKEGKDLGILAAAKSKYPTKAELLNEIGVHSQFWHDLYVVVADFDKSTGKTVTLQIHVNPTVRLVWVSVFLFVIGGLVALTDRHRGSRSRDVLAASWQMSSAAQQPRKEHES
jgi:cytochrome c-type biogenesis protein CcmF